MMNPRKWTAWKLTQLAELLYDSERTETVVICTEAEEEVVRIEVLGNTYGMGISGIGTYPGFTLRWT